MENTAQTFGRANWCDGGACLEVSFHARRTESSSDAVFVRNSRFPERVECVARERWRHLVTKAQADGHVDLATWFPRESYGDFAQTFTEMERRAFEFGILRNEPQLVGIPA